MSRVAAAEALGFALCPFASTGDVSTNALLCLVISQDRLDQSPLNLVQNFAQGALVHHAGHLPENQLLVSTSVRGAEGREAKEV